MPEHHEPRHRRPRRATHTKRAVAVLAISDQDEYFRVRDLRLRAALTEAVFDRVAAWLHRDEWAMLDDDLAVLVLDLPAGRAARVRARLNEISAWVAREPLVLADGSVHKVDVGVGWDLHDPRVGTAAALEPALTAAQDAVRQRDLDAKQFRGPRRSTPFGSIGAQVALSYGMALLAPFFLLVGLHQSGLELGSVAYWVAVAVLAVTSATLWSETFHSLDPPQPPELLDGPAPSASAVIAAYLPNEAETIVATVRSFLAQEYAGTLQVVLAYNTPRPLPVEAELAEIAAADDRLLLLPVPDSTSKAQNVNAALWHVTGEFVGIFDADHHPMAGAFDRARRWLEGGYDVVQGHCVIRNGAESALTRLVAAEFEQIYAVSHPGRSVQHGFALFGGSNGYWRTAALRELRMRGSRLTEDIDASIRAVGAGLRIASDPGLVSHELAPVTVRSLWHQRLRWAQGWFQVSVSSVLTQVRNPVLDARQRFGMFVLLGWREAMPWFSTLPLPVLAYLFWRDGSVDLTSPLFLLTTLYTLLAGPVQALAAWRLAVPSLRVHPGWFVWYALVTLLVYSEAKNAASRVAQLKHLRGERQWVVTPRLAPAPRSQAADPALRA
ncbi:glycosyltransferase family 2 protein [Phycicoccus sp. CSK15P-2]|uniref:glycosyltransferase family 2 protein n=1 Tax=Phycicoccus sp. CSK15P-2 TaxID=2807627 RepID=UPI00194E75DC|nr:glycosyltransferase family 2 protein [Phycicoccus sp. CSK15P-2]MBM6404402.1 glycosyltransferase family 2 protein [Phycicoccus sp. CSK15P-2]